MSSDVLSDLETLARELAPRLPTGLVDPQAAQKLNDEQRELYDALRQGDWQGALTELADVGYYVGKALANGLISPDRAMQSCIAAIAAYVNLYPADPTPPMSYDLPSLVRAKYESRIAHGKDDVRERVACLEVL